MLLMGICKQMIMEKHGSQLCIGKKAFHQSFISSSTGDIVPSIGSSIRNNGIKLYKMDMISHDIRQSLHLKWTLLNIFRQQVCKPDFNAVTRIGSYHQRFRLYLSSLHLMNICFQSSMFFQLFLQYEESALGIVPSMPIISHLRLDRRYFKHFHLIVPIRTATSAVRMAGTGICVKRPRLIRLHKICLFQRSRFPHRISIGIQYPKRRLKRPLARLPIDKVGIPRMLPVFLRRTYSVF